MIINLRNEVNNGGTINDATIEANLEKTIDKVKNTVVMEFMSEEDVRDAMRQMCITTLNVLSEIPQDGKPGRVTAAIDPAIVAQFNQAKVLAEKIKNKLIPQPMHEVLVTPAEALDEATAYKDATPTFLGKFNESESAISVVAPSRSVMSAASILPVLAFSLTGINEKAVADSALKDDPDFQKISEAGDVEFRLVLAPAAAGELIGFLVNYLVTLNLDDFNHSINIIASSCSTTSDHKEVIRCLKEIVAAAKNPDNVRAYVQRGVDELL